MEVGGTPSSLPPIKRTYSRLSRPLDPLKEPQSMDIVDPAPVLQILDSVKKCKITDFFRRRPDCESDELPSSPLSNLKLNSSPLVLPKSDCLPLSGAEDVSLTDTTKTHSRFTPHTLTLRQSFLDLGQRNLVSSQCLQCLMHYNKSFPEDVRLHKRFHSQYLKGFTFPLKDREKYEEVAEVAPPQDCLVLWKTFRFFAISQFSDRILKRTFADFLGFVNVQLGAEPHSADELKSRGFRAVFAVEAKTERMSGFVLTEPISKAFKSVTGCSDAAIELDYGHGSDQAKWGISRIWVREDARKRGMASLLLDIVSSSDRSLIAFSQPTPAGFAFAKRFLHSDQCPIYTSRN